MNIALLQDEIYVPSLGGATKANRFLFEEFSRRGHRCLALTRALTSSPDGPNNQLQFMQEMASRQTVVRAAQPHVYSYEYQGVQVEALNFASIDERRDHLQRRIEDFQADWVFVADDKRRFVLEAAIRAAGDRVIRLVQTIIQLPFGPLAVQANRQQIRRLRKARAIIVISEYLKQYVQAHSGLESHLLHLPVFGEGPFPNLARFDAGFVTMINPCEMKGVTIFLALARERPSIEFAAVPTWGTNERVLRALEELPNVHILEPADEIEEILAQTRVLLTPSLWPETYGYVVTEAMLRGIPVLASDIGGLPEAKLDVDYLLPIAPAEWRDGSYIFPPQNTEPWSQALGELLVDREVYERCSRRSREAALEFVSGISAAPFERLMADLDGAARAR